MILPISIILTKFICSFVLGITTFSLAILAEFNKDIILSPIETLGYSVSIIPIANVIIKYLIFNEYNLIIDRNTQFNRIYQNLGIGIQNHFDINSKAIKKIILFSIFTIVLYCSIIVITSYLSLLCSNSIDIAIIILVLFNFIINLILESILLYKIGKIFEYILTSESVFKLGVDDTMDFTV